MKTFETILKRRSIRKYLNKDIKESDLTTLMKAAMAAPSARGQEAWQFYIIKDKDVQTKIKKLSPYYNFNSPVLIIVAANLNYLVKDDTFWVQDCAAATQNILLQAAELNLGTCWCGIYPKEEAVKEIKKILKLDDYLVPLSLIHVGYPNEVKSKRTRYKEEKITVI